MKLSPLVKISFLSGEMQSPWNAAAARGAGLAQGSTRVCGSRTSCTDHRFYLKEQ